jgi:hypothetical protein
MPTMDGITPGLRTPKPLPRPQPLSDAGVGARAFQAGTDVATTAIPSLSDSSRTRGPVRAGDYSHVREARKGSINHNAVSESVRHIFE